MAENKFTKLGYEARNKRDYETAMKYFKQAAEENDETAICIVANMYANGEGVPRNKAEAQKWRRKLFEIYKKQFEEGKIEAGYGIFRMYTDGQLDAADGGRLESENYLEDIMYWLKKMANIKPSETDKYTNENFYRNESMYDIADIYHHGKSWRGSLHVDTNIKEAIKWYKKIIEDKYCYSYKTESMLALGIIYYKGNGVERDYSEAKKWFQMAAKSEFEASYALYMMYRDGIGVEKDLEESARWYEKAKSQYHSGRWG